MWYASAIASVDVNIFSLELEQILSIYIWYYIEQMSKMLKKSMLLVTM